MEGSASTRHADYAAEPERMNRMQMAEMNCAQVVNWRMSLAGLLMKGM